ncbi:MAG: hypothetical protein AAGC65_09895 [Mucilaginibacter sp.]|uniref:hypothetical protein n=1 Tax=Mucilaginibacter sp. TaxID=1882438 RepID=UPI00319EF0E4
MKVLVVTYDYHPDKSPNTYRWKNVLEAWVMNGVEVFVVSAQKEGFSEFENVNGVNVYRTGRSLVEKIRFKLLKKDTGKKLSDSKSVGIAKESLMRKIHDRTWKKIYFPDFAFLWRRPSMKLAQELIEKENITNLITVSWPFTDHVVGHKLKKKYGINWIADTIDPFYLSDAVNNKALYHSLKYKLEKRILSSADKVTVLTDKLKNKYALLYPLIANKLIVNHNLFIPYEVNGEKRSIQLSKIKLVFVGTLTPVTRSPKIVLELFSELIRYRPDLEMQLHFYGDTVQCNSFFNLYNSLLNEKIFIHGLVPRNDIPIILADADVLVNIGNSNEYQEPSKLIEYIYLGKPILNVCSIIDDSSKEILDNYPLNLNIHETEIHMAEILDKVLTFFEAKQTLKENFIPEMIENYLLPEVEKRYFSLLN